MKNKKNKLPVNFIITLVIILGYIVIVLLNYSSYKDIISSNTKNITKLTSSNIYSDINSEITKPIFVGLTMANDSFLINWLETQENKDSIPLKKYLNGIKNKYNYDSVFLISDKTKHYYNNTGLFKNISTKNEHDKWYYKFLEETPLYDLDVDQDEAANHMLTVFINCKIYNQKNDFLGVTGVGVKMEKIQELFNTYESEYELETFLINSDGLIQAHSNSEKIEKENFFDTLDIKIKDKIINNKTSMCIFNYSNQGVNYFIITRYIPDFDWYLVVKKDTSFLIKSFYSQLIKDILILSLILFIILFIVSKLIKKHENELSEMAKIDALTNLANRRGFDETLEEAYSLYSNNKLNIFIFDIDCFKCINDLYGHVVGDKVLIRIGEIAKLHFNSPDFISRWGGDEFAGFIITSDVEKTFNSFYKLIKEDEFLSKYNITISAGIANKKTSNTIDELLSNADKALYIAKQTGKDKYKFY